MMTVVRGVLVAATLAAPLAAHTSRAHLNLLTVVYLSVVFAAELLRRHAHPIAARSAAAIAVLDGAFVVCAVAATGGPMGLDRKSVV